MVIEIKKPVLRVFSKYKPIAFKILTPPFPKFKIRPTTCGNDDEGTRDDDTDITTGATTRFLSGVECGTGRIRHDTVATQVGPRGHEAGLGGHNDSASGVDEGVEKASLPLSKRGRFALSESATFSGFVPARKENSSENQNPTNTTIESCSIHDIVCQDNHDSQV